MQEDAAAEFEREKAAIARLKERTEVCYCPAIIWYDMTPFWHARWHFASILKNACTCCTRGPCCAECSAIASFSP